MPARDAMEFINEQDEATVHRFLERLEFRGRDPTFVGYRDAHVALRHASEAGVFFAACNYDAYIARR
jgi:hypothetical protein